MQISFRNAKRMLILIFSVFTVALPGHFNTSMAQEAGDPIAEMYNNPWRGPRRVSESPIAWDFSFTRPIKKLLESGSVNQNELLKKLSDQRIKDQVIFVLGEIGNEDVIGPIIDAMIDKAAMAQTPNSDRINLTANLALTNLTVADVIWPHRVGTVNELCTDDPKSCWQKWWRDNRDTFTVRGVRAKRHLENWPTYGYLRQKR